MLIIIDLLYFCLNAEMYSTDFVKFRRHSVQNKASKDSFLCHSVNSIACLNILSCRTNCKTLTSVMNFYGKKLNINK